MLRRIGRALARRCPHCGERGIFRRWGTLVDQCPRCEARYEREEGYWLGAILINTSVTIVTFGAAMVVWAVVTWPDPPWGTMTAVGVVINLVVPLLFYPLSKTLWVALESGVNPPTRQAAADSS